MVDSRIMQDMAYNRLADLAFVVAILSALLFDRIPALRLQIGAVGILAACVAAATYLIKNWHPRTTKTCENEVSASLDAEQQQDERDELGDSDLALSSQRVIAARQLQLRPARLVWLRHPRQFSVQDDVVSRVIAIVDKLSTQQNAASYEFVLSPTGAFTIRIADRVKMASETAAEAAQEGADLPYEPALPN